MAVNPNLFLISDAVRPSTYLDTDLTLAGALRFYYDKTELWQYDSVGKPRLFTGSKVSVPTEGNGKITIDGTIYTIVDLSDYYTITQLGSSEVNDSGANKIGISTISGLTATNVQVALEQLFTKADESEDDLQEFKDDLASTAAGKGADLIGIEDAAALFNSNTVEDALLELMQQVMPAIKTILKDGENSFKYNFYTKANAVLGTDTPYFVLDIPAEMFLDTTDTKFYDDFDSDAWITAHPAATQAEKDAATAVDEKPVLVLAMKTVKSDGTETISYSFINMEALVVINTFTSTTTVTLVKDVDNDVTANVNIASTGAYTNNRIQVIAGQGLYVAPEEEIAFQDSDSIKATEVSAGVWQFNATWKTLA